MPITIRGYGIDERNDQLLAIFTLSEVPDPAWIQFFRDRSAYSRFDYTTATIRRNLLEVELPERDELASLVQSVEGLIHAANLDHQFHAA